MQIKKAQVSSYVTLTFLISQGEDSAGAVSNLHNEVGSDTAYAAVTQHCPSGAVQVFITTGSPTDQLMLFCCFSVHKYILFFSETQW